MDDGPRRVLGRTGLEVSPLGLGLAALGRPGYINLGHGEDLGAQRSVDDLEARAHEVLDAAWEAGVRYLDAARSYGRAEAFLGSWLEARGHGRPEAVVGSKWGYAYTAGWRVDAETHEVKELTPGQLRRQWPESRALLGDHLAVYQMHSATPEAVADPALLDALEEVRGAGVAVGLSTSGPGQARTIEAALATGRFDTVQTTWNLLERSAEDALRAAHDAGLGVIVKEAVANGRLTARGDVSALTEAAARRGVAPDALALAAALAQPWADVVLSGAATIGQLRSNLGALEVRWEGELDDAAETPDAYWAARGALAWT